MKTNRLSTQVALLAILSAFGLQPSASLLAAPLGTAFTYQGKLGDSGAPANGLYDLSFRLYDAPTGGTLQSIALGFNAWPVTNGLFTVPLDFGSNVFTGQALWLQIDVMTNGGAGYASFPARQRLTPAPYALYAPQAGSAATVAGNSVTAHGLSTPVPPAAGQALTFNGTSLAWASPTGAAVSNAWLLGGNAGTTAGANFLGTTDDQPLEFKVNGQRVMRLEIQNGPPNIIGGSPDNLVAPGVYGCTIGGGYLNTIQSNTYYSTIGGGWENMIQTNAIYATIAGGRGNTNTANNTTIAGGFRNAATKGYAFVGGGSYNQATGAGSFVGGGGMGGVSVIRSGTNNLASGYNAVVVGGMDNTAAGNFSVVAGGTENNALAGETFVGGGWQNMIQTNAVGATIAGGFNNTNSAPNATISGGWHNQIPVGADFATVPGGRNNVAGGSDSLAAGRRAKALHEGAFVWADATGADFASTAANQFLIRAGGGVGVGTSNPQAALDVAGTVRANSFQGDGSGLTGLSASSLGGGTVTKTITFNPPSGPPFIAANQNVATGLNADFLDGWHGSHYWQLGGNSGVGSEDFLGTTDNAPLELRVNGQRALRLEPTPIGAPNVIGGASVNWIEPTTLGAVIAGGGAANVIPAPYSNSISGDFGFIGGGANNVIQTYSDFSTIGGGYSNRISLWEYATIGGGGQNLTSGKYATIGGGWGNAVSSHFATVPGGYGNLAGGQFSFAAGYRAKAHGAGSFVWGDSTDADVHAWGADQFVVRAAGGYWLFSGVDGTGFPTAGVTLAAGSGSWSSWCDRNAKTNLAPVDACAVLERVVALPIATWNYRTQDPSIQHIGPMAQDFHAAFGVGETDTGIATVDAEGVALAAIQGLNQKLEAAVKDKDARIAELERRLAALEQLVKSSTK